MLSGMNLAMAVLAFVLLAFWLLRRRSRIASTSLSLNGETSPTDN